MCWAKHLNFLDSPGFGDGKETPLGDNKTQTKGFGGIILMNGSRGGDNVLLLATEWISDNTAKGKPKHHWSGAVICQRSDRAEVLIYFVLNFLFLGQSDIFPVGGWIRIEEIHLSLF